jgi:hypothetical protein
VGEALMVELCINGLAKHFDSRSDSSAAFEWGGERLSAVSLALNTFDRLARYS